MIQSSTCFPCFPILWNTRSQRWGCTENVGSQQQFSRRWNYLCSDVLADVWIVHKHNTWSCAAKKQVTCASKQDLPCCGILTPAAHFPPPGWTIKFGNLQSAVKTVPRIWCKLQTCSSTGSSGLLWMLGGAGEGNGGPMKLNSAHSCVGRALYKTNHGKQKRELKEQVLSVQSLSEPGERTQFLIPLHVLQPFVKAAGLVWLC